MVQPRLVTIPRNLCRSFKTNDFAAFRGAPCSLRLLCHGIVKAAKPAGPEAEIGFARPKKFRYEK
jgi:hypothetical protein